jgi:phosphate transport system protein
MLTSTGYLMKTESRYKEKAMPRKSLDLQLQYICDDLLILSSMVETALAESVSALKDHDIVKSRCIYDKDSQINAKRFALEAQILTTIATQAPVLFDLRFLSSALNVCTELERIGDYAKTISRINIMSEGIGIPRLLILIQEMGIKTTDMLHRAMTAFVHTNVPSAVRIISDDDIIDEMYNNIHSELMEFVTREAHVTERINLLLWVGHNLERAGDRITNICERTIYDGTGEFGNLAFLNPHLPN